MWNLSKTSVAWGACSRITSTYGAHMSQHTASRRLACSGPKKRKNRRSVLSFRPSPDQISRRGTEAMS